MELPLYLNELEEVRNVSMRDQYHMNLRYNKALKRPFPKRPDLPMISQDFTYSMDIMYMYSLGEENTRMVDRVHMIQFRNLREETFESRIMKTLTLIATIYLNGLAFLSLWKQPLEKSWAYPCIRSMVERFFGTLKSFSRT